MNKKYKFIKGGIKKSCCWKKKDMNKIKMGDKKLSNIKYKLWAYKNFILKIKYHNKNK